MALVRIVREPGRGPRNYVLGRRVHHGAIGVALFAVGVAADGRFAAPLILAGLALMAHDAHDFPWMHDRDAFHFARRRS